MIEREFYLLSELADQWNCKLKDLIHLGIQDRLQICVNIYGMASGMQMTRLDPEEDPNAVEGSADYQTDAENVVVFDDWLKRSMQKMPDGIFEIGRDALRFIDMPNGLPFELHEAMKYDGRWWNVDLDPPVMISADHLCMLNGEAKRLGNLALESGQKKVGQPMSIANVDGNAERVKTAKPYYSIAELAKLFDDDYYRIADGLISCGAMLIFEGKPADISKWERPSPTRRGPNGEYIIFVTTGGRSGPIPDPEEVIISVEAMPVSWVQSIDELESRDRQDGNGVVTMSGDTYERLQRAVVNFPNKFNGYEASPPLMKEVVYWLQNAGISSTDRERLIFAKMLAEHFKFSSDT